MFDGEPERAEELVSHCFADCADSALRVLEVKLALIKQMSQRSFNDSQELDIYTQRNR